MIVVIPSATVEQHADDVVLYELNLQIWDGEFGPSPKFARDPEFSVVEKRGGGTPLVIEAVPSQPKPGPRSTTLRVSGGRSGGVYEVVRSVETKAGEKRRKFFKVRIT